MLQITCLIALASRLTIAEGKKIARFKGKVVAGRLQPNLGQLNAWLLSKGLETKIRKLTWVEVD